ncbi:MAG TPA: hypothetical protein DIT05_16730 [Morganella sp. (in: Bacteria)]|nr:hypothetical protein [Morganella sp. (in: enterobacteria)]
MDKYTVIFNAEHKSSQIAVLFDVIFDHIHKQEEADRRLVDLIGIVSDLNDQIRCSTAAVITGSGNHG